MQEMGQGGGNSTGQKGQNSKRKSRIILHGGIHEIAGGRVSSDVLERPFNGSDWSVSAKKPREAVDKRLG